MPRVFKSTTKRRKKTTLQPIRQNRERDSRSFQAVPERPQDAEQSTHVSDQIDISAQQNEESSPADAVDHSEQAEEPAYDDSIDEEFLNLDAPEISQDLPGSGARGRHQSHSARKENEEKNFQEYRCQALETYTEASCQQRVSDHYEAMAAFFRDSTTELVQQARCPACGLCASQSGDPVISVPVCVITTNSFTEVDVPLFQCSRCPGHPIFHADPLLCGAFPASPVHAINLHLGRLDRKRTWFSLELLDLLASLRKNNAHTAVDSFTKTMSELHLKCCKQSLPSYEVVRRQLGKAIEEYEILLYNSEQQVLDVIQDASLIGCCAACSTETAEEDHEAASSSEEANIIQCQLFGDGNFRLPHLRNAGQSTKHEPPIASRILGDTFVQNFCNLPAANLAAADQNECNDFNADKQLGRTKDLFDITGVFGAFCRHGMLICALNMVTGERWSYATCILSCLLSSGLVPDVWWYDINCRYKGHFNRWLEDCDLPLKIKEAARQMKFPLPPWHHGMHNAQCQSANTYRRMQGVGSGVGEPPEQAWSHLGPFGYILQKTSLPARQAFLERTIAHWNAAKLAKLPAALRQFFDRAVREHAAATEAAEELLQWGSSTLGISEEEVMERVDQTPDLDAQSSESEAALSWQGLYVSHLLELEDIEKAESSRIPSTLLSGSLSGTVRYEKVHKKLKIIKLIGDHERIQGLRSRWSAGEGEFEEGFKELCLHSIQLAQQKIAVLVQEFLLLEQLFERVKSRRGDTKRLMKGKQKQRSKVEAAVQHWDAWRAALNGSNPRAQSSVSSRIGAFLRAEYPWDADSQTGIMEVLKSKLTLQLELIERNEEEIQLLSTEAARATATITRQLLRIDSLLQENSADQQRHNNVQHCQDDPAKLDYEKAHQMELIRSEMDSLKGFAQRLGDKKQQLIALRKDLVSAEEYIKVSAEEYKKAKRGLLETDESCTELGVFVNEHISNVVGEEDHEVEQDRSEQHWLHENTERPL